MNIEEKAKELADILGIPEKVDLIQTCFESIYAIGRLDVELEHAEKLVESEKERLGLR